MSETLVTENQMPGGHIAKKKKSQKTEKQKEIRTQKYRMKLPALTSVLVDEDKDSSLAVDPFIRIRILSSMYQGFFWRPPFTSQR
ncbi:hypothetical protein V9T40_014166 [Parthenolecanium corni]|uniref:Uncharacterized protein n=1 Tax=Parthenolecanium corni TaxID=536013 RepID=A0AAN9TGA4_9HEMI